MSSRELEKLLPIYMSRTTPYNNSLVDYHMPIEDTRQFENDLSKDLSQTSGGRVVNFDKYSNQIFYFNFSLVQMTNSGNCLQYSSKNRTGTVPVRYRSFITGIFK